jgi:hypothetical protein
VGQTRLKPNRLDACMASNDPQFEEMFAYHRPLYESAAAWHGVLDEMCGQQTLFPANLAGWM